MSPIASLVLILPTAAGAEAVAAGHWQIASTFVDLQVPGMPAFLLRMAKGRTTTERKCLSPELAQSGAAALLAPDPKPPRCRVDSQTIASGHYVQTLSCPQKGGTPLQVSRSGTYDADGFAGQAQVTGTTRKGPTRIALDQRATHIAGRCAT